MYRYVDQKGLAAMSFIYTFVQCAPLLVEKAGVASDMTFGITACKQEECKQEIHSGFETHEEGHTKRGTMSGSTK